MAEETKVKESKKFDLTKLNNLAVVSLATAVTGFGAVAGVITGHVALAQIKRSGEAGRPAALAGLIVGYAFVLLGLASVVFGAFARGRGYEFGTGQIHQFDVRMDGGFGMGDDRGGMMFDPNQSIPAPTPSTN